MEKDDIFEPRNHPNKCFSCAYLYHKADDYIGISPRRTLFKRDIDSLKQIGFSFNCLACYRRKLPSFYLTGWKDKDILKRITQDDCPRKWGFFTRSWKVFINGQGPTNAAQQESNKWSQPAFWAVIISIILSLIYFILSQFIFD